MRKIIFSLLLIGLGVKGWCQFPSHKLDIDVGLQWMNPIGAKEKDGLYTLFANYESTLGFTMAGKYKIKPNVLVGMRIGMAQFSSHAEESELLLINPTSSFLRTTFLGGYVIDLSKWLPVPITLQTIVEVGLARHRMEVEGFRLFSESAVQAAPEYSEMDVTAGLSAQLSYDLSFQHKVFLALDYQFMNAGHVLYEEGAFHSVQMALGVTFKFKHNKYFRFER